MDAPTYGNSFNKLFLSIINDTSLELFVHLPTRQNKIILLDLVFSSHPKISHLVIVPGISDHDAITFDLDIIHKTTSSFINTKLLYIIREQ